MSVISSGCGPPLLGGLSPLPRSGRPRYDTGPELGSTDRSRRRTMASNDADRPCVSQARRPHPAHLARARQDQCMDNPARHRTVGLVGLGVIGRVHLGVLTADPRVTLAFVADPRAGTHPESARRDTCGHYKDLSAALSAVESGEVPAPDVVVLATPTTTHLDLASDVLDRTTSTILSEKPLTGDAEQLRAFERRHRDTASRVHVVNHFAF